MKRMDINIMGVSEVRWTGQGKITVGDGYMLIYSGGKEHARGVGFMLDPNTSKSVLGTYAVSDRVIAIKLQAKPLNIGLIQVYAPTSQHSDDEIEDFYDQVDQAMSSLGKEVVKFISGDFNAVVGHQQQDDIVGPHGLGYINERGTRLINWCKKHNLMITNTWFQNHKRRKWTWKRTGDTGRFQIDYILAPKRFRNAVLSSNSTPVTVTTTL